MINKTNLFMIGGMKISLSSCSVQLYVFPFFTFLICRNKRFQYQFCQLFIFWNFDVNNTKRLLVIIWQWILLVMDIHLMVINIMEWYNVFINEWEIIMDIDYIINFHHYVYQQHYTPTYIVQFVLNVQKLQILNIHHIMVKYLL